MSPCLAQHANDFRVVECYCVIKRGIAIAITDMNRCTKIQQVLYNVDMSLAASDVQWCATIVITHVELGTLSNTITATHALRASINSIITITCNRYIIS